MQQKVYFFFFILFFPLLLNAQMQQPNAAEIAIGMQKLSVKGSVLYIAAHPDDENTRLLAYLAKEMKMRTGYLSLTRGDGGQNLIGNEQAELLGSIRTQELLAARRVDGAEQFFTRANDFGFSKTSDESFKIWGKEQVLADVVWVIRNFKPDVIIARFPEDARAGHGHHAGSGILAREAFTAAADPNRFPEQLKYVKIWKGKRMVWNTFNFGGNNTTSSDQLKLDVGLYNPLLGKSYGEIAAISRTNHKSQGFGSALQRGSSQEYFTPVAGETAKNSIFDGVKTTIEDKNIQALITSIQTNYKVTEPWLAIPNLLKLKKLTQPIDFNHQLVDELILACAGVWIEVNTAENIYAVGDSIPVTIQAIARSNIKNITINTPNRTVALIPNRLIGLPYKLVSSQTTQPYYLQQEHPIGQYIIPNQQDVGHPENPNPLSVKLTLKIDGESIEINSPVVFKSIDPIKGERYQPLVLAPTVTATLSEKAYVFNSNTAKKINVQLKNFRDKSRGFITPLLPNGWKSIPEKIDFDLAKKGDEQNISFEITPGNDVSGMLTLQINVNGRVDDKGLKLVSYDHIPNITIFPKSTARLEKIDLKIVGTRVAYIDGAGDLVPEALREMGYEVTKLNASQVLSNDLSIYDAIVTGVRLYNINPDVKIIQPKLLKYVENGGTLLIQYNVNTGLKTTEIGPYPFKISRDRTTEEDAKVNFLQSENAALNYPNIITAKDFEGWVQERGLYFASDIDPRYSTIFSMKDSGETASNGSLLIAGYGKGKFVYTSLVFFRQLPAGVPGAYRLFANLLAPKQP